MAFVGILLIAALFCMLGFGLSCAAAAIVLAVLHRRKERRWMKIAAIVCGISAAVCIALPIAFLLFVV